jgi:hypothetical protein
VVVFTGIGHSQVTSRFATTLQQGRHPSTNRVLFGRASSEATRRSGAIARKLLSLVPTVPMANAKFYSATQLTAGGYSYSDVLVGDFNGDGQKDLASVVYAGIFRGAGIYKLSVLLGGRAGAYSSLRC